MRIFTVCFLAGSAVVAANSVNPDQPETSTSSQQAVIAVPNTVDPIITGQTISSENIADWEAQSKRYRQCPECEEKQPFPGD